MSKPLTNLLLVTFVAVGIAGCAGSPTTASSGTSSVPPANVTPEITAMYQSAVTTLKSGADDKALVQFTTIITKAPQLAGAHINIGLIQLKKHQFAEAEKAFEQAIDANKQNAQAQNYLGVALREQGKFAKAKEAYQHAIQLDNNYADAHLNLGILYDIYLYDLSNALEQYEKYQDLTSNKDEQVNKWIADIKLRQSKAK